MEGKVDMIAYFAAEAKAEAAQEAAAVAVAAKAKAKATTAAAAAVTTATATTPKARDDDDEDEDEGEEEDDDDEDRNIEVFLEPKLKPNMYFTMDEQLSLKYQRSLDSDQPGGPRGRFTRDDLTQLV